MLGLEVWQVNEGGKWNGFSLMIGEKSRSHSSSAKKAKRRRKLVKSPVSVEKLFPRKRAEKTLRYEAQQATISVLLDIFYLPNVSHFDKTGVFQQPRLRRNINFTRRG